MNITTNNTVSRKELAQKLAEHLSLEPTYSGPPAFAYRVGDLTVDREGSVTGPDEMESDVRTFLEELGAVDIVPETIELEVSAEGMDGYALRNLVNTLHGKQYLINRVIGFEGIRIPTELTEELARLDSAKASEVRQAAEKYAEGTVGFEITEDRLVFSIPKFDDGLTSALGTLFTLAVEAAKKAKRVSAKLETPENEKYYFRIWLVRLGLAGKEAKTVRRAMLDRLKGNSAFRTPEDAAKFAADQKAKRDAKKAALTAADDDNDDNDGADETPAADD